MSQASPLPGSGGPLPSHLVFVPPGPSIGQAPIEARFPGDAPRQARASLAYSTASPGARARRSRITPPCQARGPPRSRALPRRACCCVFYRLARRVGVDPGKAGQKTLKRKLPSGLARLDCRGCKFRKLEHAFPRAQLQQDDSEAKRRCLKCLKEVESLSCSTCLSEKPISEFSSAMATMPWAAACGSCAKDAKTKLRQGRAGWFTCRTCEVFFPEAAVANCDGDALHARRQRCLNCASRGSWARGKSTCRKCGGVWSQPREQGDKRQRLCPKCRPKATSAKRL